MHLVRLQVLAGHALDVLGGDLLHLGLGFLEEILRISVVLVGHLPVDDLTPGIEVENEGIKEALLGQAQFFLRDLIGLHPLHFVQQGTGGLDRGFRFGHAPHVENTRERVIRTVDAENRVGQSLLRPYVAEETARKPAAQDIVHDLQGEVVRIVHETAQVPEYDGALVDVVLAYEMDGTVKGIVDSRQIRSFESGFLPTGEDLRDLLHHVVRVEISPDAEHGIVRVVPGLVKSHQVVPGDGVDGGVLGMAHVHALRSVDQLSEFTEAHAGWVVVPPGDGRSRRDLFQFDLVIRKDGMHEDIGQNRQRGIDIVLQDRHGRGTGNPSYAGFDGCANALEGFVDLVARHLRGPARAHHGAHDTGQADLVRRFVYGAHADSGAQVDHRQAVVFNQVQDDPVIQNDPCGRRSLDIVERRVFQVFVVLLGTDWRNRCKQAGQHQAEDDD